MTGGILVTGWNREGRVVWKVLLHYLFFLNDPHPEHQKIEGETDHENHPSTHDQCQSD